MTFDLDPGEGVDWPQIQEATLLVRTLLDELGLPSFLKTSGGKGLHVVVPIRRQYGWDEVKGFSQAVVVHLARTIPDRFVAKSGPRNRVGKVFVDYLRNGFGATTVSAWSARSRPGLGVSVPVAWDELPALTSAAQWTLANVADRFATGNKPWAALERSRKGIAAAMKMLDYKPG
jgi:bifunctional non-homologous end joining protein LigD